MTRVCRPCHMKCSARAVAAYGATYCMGAGSEALAVTTTV